MKLNCFRCNIELEDFSYVQPLKGLAFISYGHYGSEYFDPMDGSTIEIVICDNCLKQNKESIYVEDFEYKPVV